jgi:hypothetical protein
MGSRQSRAKRMRGMVMWNRPCWRNEHWTYLRAVHELAEGADTNGVEPIRVLDHLSLPEEDAEAILEFLVEAGVLRWPAGGEILLTELGAATVERMAGVSTDED